MTLTTTTPTVGSLPHEQEPHGVGGLFFGYGGLDAAITAVFGEPLVWYADVCKFNDDGTAGHHTPHRGPCAVGAYHHPGVPNLGDVTTINWATVPRPKVMGGGSPCQDLSHAGKRRGMTEGTRSNLWVSMREGIAVLRPPLVVWENVRGAASSAADSDLEHCPGCMGGTRHRGPALRALGRVVGDLSDLGYDCRWFGLPAASVGAPHPRFRFFLLAYLRGTDPATYAIGPGLLVPTLTEVGTRYLLPTPNPFHAGNTEQPDDWRERRADVKARTGTSHGPALSVVALSVEQGEPLTPDNYMPAGVEAVDEDGEPLLLPTPTTQDGANTGGPSQLERNTPPLNAQVLLLKTPNANLAVNGGSQHPDKRRDGGHGPTLADEVEHLLPTPTTSDAGGPGRHGAAYDKSRDLSAVQPGRLLPTPTHQDVEASGGGYNGKNNVTLTDATLRQTHGPQWGDYAPAIARWEQALHAYDRMAEQLLIPGYEPVGRPAPAPTEPGQKGQPRLSPRFVEWMMGLPDGHVTAVPGLSRNDQLKLLGNGVVPQQAVAALYRMIGRAP